MLKKLKCPNLVLALVAVLAVSICLATSTVMVSNKVLECKTAQMFTGIEQAEAENSQKAKVAVLLLNSEEANMLAMAENSTEVNVAVMAKKTENMADFLNNVQVATFDISSDSVNPIPAMKNIGIKLVADESSAPILSVDLVAVYTEYS